MAKTIIVDRVKVVTEMARQNLTNEELAQKAGVGRAAIWKMRKGQSVWRTTAQHVARALDVPMESLMEETETEV
ncbi:MAG: helix-turn-helix transcriptional regulator [Faecalibacterium prausnitzii]|nr:helix-turn-helix transcriptional regulator [Faecalibacterium prausnitzii]